LLLTQQTYTLSLLHRQIYVTMEHDGDCHQEQK